MTSNNNTLPSYGNDDDDFTSQYTLKYTGFGFQAPNIPIFRYNDSTGYPTDPSLETPDYTISRVNDKLQLASTRPKETNLTIMAYLKKQKIEIRDAPELTPGSKVLESITVEWYSTYSQPKLYDIKLPDGKLYRWWSAGDGVFELLDKSKDATNKDAAIARIAAAKADRRVIVISITNVALDKGSGLTESVILVSAVGVLKKCEKNLVHFGWFDAGASAKANSFMSFFSLAGSG
ncbi:hypothetical protein AOL_s00054g265 [Orbilia oligospora ATCC 24927]|uniref:Uncharacterized protein n=1 Tax=Arthrobotrys oligospora (strain ATCC 24927 / CBS 115.81 / DSM 1491) TaxID=756982 RepID=G1X5X1_ARTOA|nr:hypothetical protein AOL_s00054g265 [Orbilia oligospora ATCC 24927]EGX51566.1 hypothetical protein AOL_s00054g265 [Orbilia oligospora ATCC 24927]